jgi:hypothetical protein
LPVIGASLSSCEFLPTYWKSFLWWEGSGSPCACLIMNVAHHLTLSRNCFCFNGRLCGTFTTGLWNQIAMSFHPGILNRTCYKQSHWRKEDRNFNKMKLSWKQ